MSPIEAGHGGAGRAGSGMTASLVIPPRFCGPPGSGNGGYVCGRIAGYLDGPVTVTLRRPPPLATPMIIDRDGTGSIRVRHDGTLIAEAARAPGGPAPEVPGPASLATPGPASLATPGPASLATPGPASLATPGPVSLAVPGQVSLAVPGPVSLAEARAAAGRARYYADPAFPGCFVCGTGREPGDGLRIFPGPLAGRPLWAAPWTPDTSVTDHTGTVPPEVVWAALDCPSGIAAAEAAGLAQDTAILLGRMAARLAVPPAAGDRCLVAAWPGGRDGRKLLAGSALLGPGGEVLAVARAVWLTVPRPAPALAAEGAS